MKKKKQKYLIFIIIIFALIIITYNLILQPKIKIICDLYNITLEEYNMINDEYREQYSSSDFKNLIIKVEGKNLRALNHRIVSIPSVSVLREAIQNYNSSAYMGIKGMTKDNIDEDNFVYDYSIMLIMKELTKEELALILEDYYIEVDIKDKFGFKYDIYDSIGKLLVK